MSTKPHLGHPYQPGAAPEGPHHSHAPESESEPVVEYPPLEANAPADLDDDDDDDDDDDE